MARKRTVKKKTTGRRVRRRSARKGRVTAPGTAIDRQARRAVAGLLKGLRVVDEHCDLALSSLAEMKESAALAREQELATSVVRENLLDDLAGLETLFDQGMADAGLERHRAVPSAVLRWVAECLNVRPILRPGDTKDIPADRLSGYDWPHGLPTARHGTLVRVRVLTCGWKWRGQVLSLPKMQIIES